MVDTPPPVTPHPTPPDDPLECDVCGPPLIAEDALPCAECGALLCSRECEREHVGAEEPEV